MKYNKIIIINIKMTNLNKNPDKDITDRPLQNKE
jgi:hypothetical protein